MDFSNMKISPPEFSVQLGPAYNARKTVIDISMQNPGLAQRTILSF